jgi:hypothetical protein
VNEEPFDRLPDEIRVSLAEFAAVVTGLEGVLRDLVATGDRDAAARIDTLIGRMGRWAWPLLGELDEGQGYDE